MPRILTIVCAATVLACGAAACGGGTTQADDGPGPQHDAAVQSDGGAADAPAPSDGGTSDAPPPSPTLPEDLPDPLPNGTPAVTVATFNTGLIALLRGAPERLPHVVDAVKGLDADVVCLQEVWTTYTTPKDFAAQVASEFPHAFWYERGTTVMGAGVLLLSKHPMYRGRALPYVTQEPGGYFEKAAVSADVVTTDSHFRVICTHTAAPTDATGPPLRIAQLEELNAFATAQGYDTGALFLLGDLNTGPDPVGACTPSTTPACNLQDVTSYAKFLETYADPNADWQQCTWCRDAALPLQISAGFSADSDGRIDHCLYKGLDADNFKSRALLFAETVSITVGTLTIEHISDHYGVSCVFGP